MKRIRGSILAVKFAAVGTFGFIVNYAILEAALALATDSKSLAAILAMLVTINLTFVLHDKWTYVRTSNDYYLKLSKRYISYLSSNSSGSLITIVIFSLLSNSLANITSLAIAAITAMSWNFFMNLIVWRHSKSVHPIEEVLVDV